MSQQAQKVPPVPLILNMFALLFSNHWINQWHKQWHQEQKQMARNPGPDQPAQKRKRQSSRFHKRIFSLRVTLWYLIYQRLSFDHSLAAVALDARQGGADRLGQGGRKLSKQIKSRSSSAYNQARQRLPVALLQAALAQLGVAILKMIGLRPRPGRSKGSKPGPKERTRQLLDGSTLAVLLTPMLATEYRPACNQKGTSDWCIIRIVVGFCARTGAVLSASEAARDRSEQSMAWALMEKAAQFMIWVADRNFGVWSVVAQAKHREQDALVRLTKARAAKLAGGRPLVSGEDRPVQWKPSRHDKIPPGLEPEAVSGRLIYVRLNREGRGIDLWLFTTLEAADYPLELLVQWYGQRWQAELHFRSVKTQMHMAQLSVCTPEMARKEFYAGLLAYSLVRAVMWAAGERLEEGVQKLSFSQARRVLLTYLEDWGKRLDNRKKGDKASARQLIDEVGGQTLPKRTKKRPNEPRKKRCRGTKFPPLRGSRADARMRAEEEAKSL